MTAYNWGNLSDHDFEAVCRDVLAVLIGRPVEIFARGADGGIDLRSSQGKSLVVGQAKHYWRSGFPKLKTAMAAEKKTLDGMHPRPTRYFLFTSVEMTSERKAELIRIASPHLKTPANVLGPEEIEGVLARNPDIEAHHYKLWLASARVIDRIMVNAARTRSQMRTDEILERARVFVEHAKMADAEQILKSQRCLIISGPPGIGKTTMAEMLALRSLDAGYEVTFVAHVDELEEHIKVDRRQMFVYDDFLGRTNFAEAPSASDQERLFTCMRYIAKHQRKYLVMTTREYPYREARVANERLAANRADLIKCVLDVSGYDPSAKARILYNHLYFTDGISQESLAQFVARKAYWAIIRHDSFNPRWIADTLNRLALAAQGDEGSPWT